jgi:uncharacterized membrane protein YfcA
MGFLFIAPFALLAGWSIFAIHRWLRRGAYGREWWKAFTVLACAGAVLGIWLAFFLQYNVANKRIAGFPIPLQIYSREKTSDPWIPGQMPVSIRIGGTVTDWLCGVAVCLVPIAVAGFFKENRIQRDAQGNPRPNPPA